MSRPQVLDSEPNSEEEFILNFSRNSQAASVASEAPTGGSRVSPASGVSSTPSSGAWGGQRGKSSGGQHEIEDSAPAAVRGGDGDGGGVRAAAVAGICAAGTAASLLRTAIAAGETPPLCQKRKVTSASCTCTIQSRPELCGS